MNELPVCRHFIACERIEQTDERGITLHRVTARVGPQTGEEYPLIRPGQSFLAVLTSGSGQHSIRVELWRGVGPNAELVWQSGAGTIDVGRDPMAVRTLPCRFDWVIDEPGQYEWCLTCDGIDIASVYIEVEGIP